MTADPTDSAEVRALREVLTAIVREELRPRADDDILATTVTWVDAATLAERLIARGVLPPDPTCRCDAHHGRAAAPREAKTDDAGASERLRAAAARTGENAVAIASNIEERFKAFIPDWREASAEAARRAPLAELDRDSYMVGFKDGMRHRVDDAGASEGLRAALKNIEFVHGICPACSGSQPEHGDECMTRAALEADSPTSV